MLRLCTLPRKSRERAPAPRSPDEAQVWHVPGIEPDRLRRDWLEGQSDDLRRRRQIIGLSIFGAAVLTLGTMRQTGLLSHLPNPPCGRFDANQVTTSDEAYALGAPDAPVAATSYLANAAVAAFGTEDRAERLPWVPLVATAKAALDLLGAAVYLRYMIVRERALCIYCLSAGAAGLGVFALTLPESARALRALSRRRALH